MFFQNHFKSVAECLDSKFKGSEYREQNIADKGELGEIFVQEFLNDALSSNLEIFRGGKAIDIHENKSKQLDVVVCGSNSITIFQDKGLYPIETIHGVISVTATLNKRKLNQCIEEFESLPKKDPQLNFTGLSKEDNLDVWKKHHPFKCVFAFNGKMDNSWEELLNKKVYDTPESKYFLPEIIVINREGMLVKIGDDGGKFVKGGEGIHKHFHYTDFREALPDGYWIPFEGILHGLYLRSKWQYHATPDYTEYFNQDMESFMENG